MPVNIGIDLGTTHSLVAVVLGRTPRCLLDAEGQAILPSVVRYGADGSVVVGARALEEAHLHPESTFSSTKRLVGRSQSDVEDELSRFRQEVLPGDPRVVRFRAPGREAGVTPVEISAEILKVLKRRAHDALLGDLGGAVITVPAWFDDAQRQATRDAARLAGLEVLRLLNEPTAAAIAYGLERSQRGRYAIYDLGGGTFDVSILELTDGVFQVLSTAGDTHLGGDDFDQAIARMALDASGFTPADLEPAELRLLAAAARRAKHVLTDEPQARVEVEARVGSIQAWIRRESFEEAIRPLVERTGQACLRALGDAGLSMKDLDGVVLVGGSTRVPSVRSFVARAFGRDPFCDLDPDQVVALGAGMQADLLGGQSDLAEDLLLLDVLPLSLGLEVMGGVVERLIPRASTIPAGATGMFTTHVDGQSAVDIHVVQGEREMVRDCRSLARFKLRGIPPMPAGLARIQVEFLVDADGILHVTAREQHTRVEASVQVTPSHGLTEEEMERMVEDAIDHAEEDVNERFLAETKVEAEGVLRNVRSALATDASLLLEGEEGRIRKVMAELEQALGGTDRRVLRTLSRRLDWVTAPFAQRRIERSLGVALAGLTADEVARNLGIAPEEPGPEGPEPA